MIGPYAGEQTAGSASRTLAALLPMHEPTRSSSRPRSEILVVENDAALRETLVDILEGAGFSVRACESPREALELLVDGGYRPAVALLDHQMPEMTGVDFRREMLSREELAPIEAVLFSGDNIDGTALRSLRMRLLRKPVGIQELLTVVGELSGRRRLPR